MTQESRNDEHLRTQLVQDMLNALDSKIDSTHLIVDFGCGEGGLVHQFRKEGLNAFGVDIENYYARSLNLLFRKTPRIYQHLDVIALDPCLDAWIELTGF